ncbi:hypothetical protein BLNAU_1586 [Blattamonas nauphoetae]|uniref:Uncharacterized protein n=1 Tax=Blattamonas nauphoetae TaxID=2049346 RepID=A0ABQ9YIF1_9EUKA|nr:hypothetical protein BLNAU_1586 [Blattamonas nauphoetae]
MKLIQTKVLPEPQTTPTPEALFVKFITGILKQVLERTNVTCSSSEMNDLTSQILDVYRPLTHSSFFAMIWTPSSLFSTMWDIANVLMQDEQVLFLQTPSSSNLNHLSLTPTYLTKLTHFILSETGSFGTIAAEHLHTILSEAPDPVEIVSTVCPLLRNVFHRSNENACYSLIDVTFRNMEMNGMNSAILVSWADADWIAVFSHRWVRLQPLILFLRNVVDMLNNGSDIVLALLLCHAAQDECLPSSIHDTLVHLHITDAFFSNLPLLIILDRFDHQIRRFISSFPADVVIEREMSRKFLIFHNISAEHVMILCHLLRLPPFAFDSLFGEAKDEFSILTRRVEVSDLGADPITIYTMTLLIELWSDGESDIPDVQPIMRRLPCCGVLLTLGSHIPAKRNGALVLLSKVCVPANCDEVLELCRFGVVECVMMAVEASPSLEEYEMGVSILGSIFRTLTLSRSIDEMTSNSVDTSSFCAPCPPITTFSTDPITPYSNPEPMFLHTEAASQLEEVITTDNRRRTWGDREEWRLASLRVGSLHNSKFLCLPHSNENAVDHLSLLLSAVPDPSEIVSTVYPLLRNAFHRSNENACYSLLNVVIKELDMNGLSSVILASWTDTDWIALFSHRWIRHFLTYVIHILGYSHTLRLSPSKSDLSLVRLFSASNNFTSRSERLVRLFVDPDIENQNRQAIVCGIVLCHAVQDERLPSSVHDTLVHTHHTDPSFSIFTLLIILHPAKSQIGRFLSSFPADVVIERELSGMLLFFDDKTMKKLSILCRLFAPRDYLLLPPLSFKDLFGDILLQFLELPSSWSESGLGELPLKLFQISLLTDMWSVEDRRKFRVEEETRRLPSRKVFPDLVSHIPARRNIALVLLTKVYVPANRDEILELCRFGVVECVMRAVEASPSLEEYEMGVSILGSIFRTLSFSASID